MSKLVVAEFDSKGKLVCKPSPLVNIARTFQLGETPITIDATANPPLARFANGEGIETTVSLGPAEYPEGVDISPLNKNGQTPLYPRLVIMNIGTT